MKRKKEFFILVFCLITMIASIGVEKNYPNLHGISILGYILMFSAYTKIMFFPQKINKKKYFIIQ